MKYKRIVVTRYGGPEVLGVVEEDLPEPGPGEVRVRILAAGVSFADILLREGIHPEARRPPFTLGWDLVGLVDKLGTGVTSPEIGQMVAALPVLGGYSETICLPSEELLPVPAGLDPAETVSLILNYGTAYQMMHRSARAKPGERALIHGAAGGVGTALLQLGRLLDLEMYGTARSDNHAVVSDLGARPIDYKRVDFVEEMAKLTDGDGVDIVFDGIGGTHVARSYRTLRPGGRVIAFGHATSLIDRTLTGGRRSRLRGLPTMAVQIVKHSLIPDRRRMVLYSIQTLKKRQPDWFREDMTALFGLLADRKIRPVIAECLPLAEAVRAHELLGQGSVTGKLVLN
jgi:NADPH2:quinone reductase